MSLKAWHHELYDGDVRREALYTRFAAWLKRKQVKEYTSPEGYRMLVVGRQAKRKK